MNWRLSLVKMSVPPPFETPGKIPERFFVDISSVLMRFFFYKNIWNFCVTWKWWINQGNDFSSNTRHFQCFQSCHCENSLSAFCGLGRRLSAFHSVPCHLHSHPVRKVLLWSIHNKWENGSTKWELTCPGPQSSRTKKQDSNVDPLESKTWSASCPSAGLRPPASEIILLFDNPCNSSVTSLPNSPPGSILGAPSLTLWFQLKRWTWTLFQIAQLEEKMWSFSE